MMFFNKRKDDDAPQVKRRSILGTMFNPDIGDSLRPLGETTSVFVQLIAMIFAMNGLFPKDHPAIQGQKGAHLTLSKIFSTAWNGLAFTKEGLPKVILFFAVAGTMVLALLSVITAIVAGFVGSAYAQTTSTSSSFFAPAGSDDLAQNWIDYIFKGIPLSDYYSQSGAPIPQTTSIQCAMISALGFYSNGMLIFAAIILFYHLVSMVVSTAHEGVVMGKRANQIWAPIRLVVAVALLVPIGSSTSSCSNGTSAGLNVGQYIVIQMAEWGSGLASQTWKTFIVALSDMKYDYIKPNAPAVYDVVSDIVKMEACKFAWNYQVCLTDTVSLGQSSSQCSSPNGYQPSGAGLNQNIPDPIQPRTDSQGGKTYNYTPVNSLNANKICGSFYVPGPTPIPTAQAPGSVGSTVQQQIDPGKIAQILATAQQSTFSGLLGQFTSTGAEIANVIPTLNTAGVNPNTDFTSLVSNYQTSLKSALDSALSSQSSITSTQATTITSLGWAAAGAWLNTIARDQGAIVNAYTDGLPKTMAPNMDALKNNSIGSIVFPELSDFNTWIKDATVVSTGSGDNGCNLEGASSGGGSSPTSGGTTPVLNSTDPAVPTVDGLINLGGSKDYDDVFSQGTAASSINVKQLVDNLAALLGSGNVVGVKQKILAIIDYQAQDSGVWKVPTSRCGQSTSASGSRYFTLGAQLVTANPLAEISFWGYANLRVAYAMLDTIVALSVAGVEQNIRYEVERFHQGELAYGQKDLQRFGLASKFYDFAAGIFGLIATIFFICGYTIAFVVPLLPFFRFFFNVLTWVVSLLEAVVAVPLVALAHLNPEGDGLPGQSAKAAYFMIFNLFLRPVMTVFGLIAGLLVFYVAIMLLNITFAIAVAGTEASYHFGIATVIRIVYTLTYGATAYVCANNCFKPIGAFPDTAMRWIGASAHHEKMGDGGRAVQGVMGQAQGFMGDKVIGIAKLRPPN